MRVEIYKKHLSEIKSKNNKSEKWNTVFPEIGKKVFSSPIDELLKYKIMICLTYFEFVEIKNSEYYFMNDNPQMESYIPYYNGIVSGLKDVSLKFVYGGDN